MLNLQKLLSQDEHIWQVRQQVDVSLESKPLQISQNKN